MQFLGISSSLSPEQSFGVRFAARNPLCQHFIKVDHGRQSTFLNICLNILIAVYSLLGYNNLKYKKYFFL